MSGAKARKASVPVAPQHQLLSDLRKVQGDVQDIFCTLESASAALEKAENENDLNRFVRAARVVDRCRDMVEVLRDDIDALPLDNTKGDSAHG